MARRARFGGQMDSLAKVVSNFVLEKDDLVYDVDFMSTTQRGALLEWRELLHALSKLQANMSFSKDSMQQGCKLAAELIGLTGAEAQSYAKHVSPRLRCMCYHTIQAWCKARGSHTAWVHAILAKKAKVEGDKIDEAEVDSDLEGDKTEKAE
eukprot:2897323-Amphidinium_carterae.1